jgi:hypothetical protein
MALKVGVGKVKGPATPPGRASFALGSRPATLRAPTPGPRIKPAAPNTTNYAKSLAPVNPNPAGASFGSTGQTGMS